MAIAEDIGLGTTLDTEGTQNCSHIQLPKIQILMWQWKWKYCRADAIVRSILLSNANYEVTWMALFEKFDNPHLIVNSHLNKLFSFSPSRSLTLDDLKNFLDTSPENIAAFGSSDGLDKEGFLLFYIASRVLVSSIKFLF
ncbi:Protein of unknown function DUF1759 [Cinara cedri]|uniref:Uncharacterized protein n=1 Tax=Cinara cedri TaxID=506608 RepID=A0A5E4ND18_9HEMI|nr:Protein of unknown function DUF1759 [Cinara cedri]